MSLKVTSERQTFKETIALKIVYSRTILSGYEILVVWINVYKRQLFRPIATYNYTEDMNKINN